MNSWTRVTLLATLWLICANSPSMALEGSADLSLTLPYTSNVFMNKEKEWDISVNPGATLALDFADIWSVGYNGHAEISTRHNDLPMHRHGLFLLVDPTWGKDGQNEFYARLAFGTERYMDSYADQNHLRPALDLGIELEPIAWFRLSMENSINYTYFYEDKRSSYLENWMRLKAQFTWQSKTSLAPRFAFGLRDYPRHGSGAKSGKGATLLDKQLEAGLHLGQGLWENAGLQADYAYLHAFDTSQVVARNMARTSFSYLDNKFLYSGHTATLGLKQVFADSWTLALAMQVETRHYLGWDALNAAGKLTGEERRDLRLAPTLSLDYAWAPKAEASSVPEVKVGLGYTFTRQFSNDDWYDTDQHYAVLTLQLGW